MRRWLNPKNMDQNIKMPKVTILMPVYNGSNYLRDAIQSILNQSFGNFEFLIIEDGSIDNSVEVIKSFDDPRIKVLSNKKNFGLVYSLNRGLENANGKYVARMDCDDVSLPNRIQEQITFMDKNTDIGVCGTWIETLEEDGGYINKYLTDPDDIKASLLFNTSLAHPSIIIRRSVLEDNKLKYDDNHKFYYEDYGLWIKLSKVTKLSNIPKVLLQYRVHKKSFSHTFSEENISGAIELRKIQLIDLGINPSENEIFLHNSLKPKDNDSKSVYEFLHQQELWLEKIISTNQITLVYNIVSLNKVIYKRWRTICGFNTSGGFFIFKTFINSPIYRLGPNIKYIDSIKILIKSILRR